MTDEDNYMQAKNVTLTPEQVRYIESIAQQYHMTFSAALRYILIDYMNQQQEEE